MLENLKAISLTSAILIAMTLVPAKSEPFTGSPEEGWGIVDIPAPAEGNLLHLVGIAGRGHAIVRMPGEDTCKSFRVRLVAGGFWGRERTPRREGIRLRLSGARLLMRLGNGDDIVSEDYRVSTSPHDPRAEITIVQGLHPEAGFVVSPGASPTADIFGPKMRRVSCTDAVHAIPAR